MAEELVYYELSWAILSTIGLLLTLLSLLVISITNSLNRIAMVPVVTSAACALANGLCYCAFYSERPTPQKVAAAIIADIAWLIQNAGLSFYSYFLLNSLLKATTRRVFLSVFWSLMTCILTIRIVIIVTRVENLITPEHETQKLNLQLHFGYFTAIALVEIFNAYYLLRIFSSTLKNSPFRSIFRRLTMSTEIRLATLSIIGVSRAILYAFRNTAQTANNVPTQIDRFVYTVECMFPVAMLIDILATKLIAAQSRRDDGGTRVRASLRNIPTLTRSGGREWNDQEMDFPFIEDDDRSAPLSSAAPSSADHKRLSRISDWK